MRNFSYGFKEIILKLHLRFNDGLKICMFFPDIFNLFYVYLYVFTLA